MARRAPKVRTAPNDVERKSYGITSGIHMELPKIFRSSCTGLSNDVFVSKRRSEVWQVMVMEAGSGKGDEWPRFNTNLHLSGDAFSDIAK